MKPFITHIAYHFYQCCIITGHTELIEGNADLFFTVFFPGKVCVEASSRRRSVQKGGNICV